MYTIVSWPEVQELMDKPGFEENASLVVNEQLLDIHGSSAYFVKEAWLIEIELEKEEEDEEKEFNFYIDQKVSVFVRSYFDIFAKTREEAVKEAIEAIEKDTYLDFYETDYLYETEEYLGPTEIIDVDTEETVYIKDK